MGSHQTFGFDTTYFLSLLSPILLLCTLNSSHILVIVFTAKYEGYEQCCSRQTDCPPQDEERLRRVFLFFWMSCACILYLTLPGCQSKVSLQGKPLTLSAIQVYHLWLWQISMACLSCSYMKVVVIGYLKIFIDDWAYTFRDKLPLYLGWGVPGALPRTINKFWSTFQSPTCLSRPAPCLWLCDEDQTLAWNVTASLYKYAKTSFKLTTLVTPQATPLKIVGECRMHLA